jgi:S1-C subfamily serine protease
MNGRDKVHFVGSTQVAPDTVLSVAGASLWNDCAATFRRIDEVCGEDASSLFAEPTVKRQDGSPTLNVAWFGGFDDVAKPLSETDTVTRSRVEADLRARMEALHPALADPQIGDTVGAMLNIDDPRSVMAVGDRALLVNWGVLPAGARDSQEAFAAHTARTLAPFLPLGVSPRVPGRPWRVEGSAEGAGISPPPKRRRPPPARAGVYADAGRAAVLPARSYTRVVLWPAIVLSAIFAAVLIYLYWPGHLLFPAAARQIDPVADLSMRQNINRGLEEQIRRLQSELAKAPCAVDATALGLAVPAGWPGRSVAPSGPATPAAAGGAQGAAAPDAAAGPQPKGANPPAETPQRQGAAGQAAPTPQSALMKTLDRATVLVLAPIPGGLSTGSGFFVTPTDVLTNRHVVDNAGDVVYLASRTLGRAVPAHVVARTASSRIGGSDFALLTIESRAPNGIRPLTLSDRVARLDSVVAAGFPSFVMQMDQNYRKIISGDDSQVAKLQLAVTRGSVMALPAAGTAQVITHSAIISPGSSGGPLIDDCGRVVGVNTFITYNNQSAEHLNFALGAADAIRFLQGHSIAAHVDSSQCSLVTAARIPPAGAAAQAAPHAAPPPAGQGN